MKSLLFIAFSVTLCLNVYSDFDAFEAFYDKNYLPTERAYRAKVFEYNMIWAKKINAEDHSFKLGPTSFADMTNTEFANSKLCGCKVSLKGFTKSTHLSTVVEEIDWREKGGVTPVINQGMCGACWAIAAVGALEGGYFAQTHKLTPLSIQQIVDCDTESHGCHGGMITSAYDYVMKHGLCSSKDYPFTSASGDCKEDQCTPAVTIKGYEYVPQNDGIALKAAVANAPVSALVEADSPMFQMYQSGVFDSAECGTALNHAMVIVGYTADYWILKNSWGANWGEKGYMRIKFTPEGAGICGINTQAIYPTF